MAGDKSLRNIFDALKTGLSDGAARVGEEEPDRGQWTGKFDFLMSMIAYAVGLGNVWRFPYLCFKNGGGSFLVVYAIFFCLAAVPIFIMEVTIGQYLQKGAMEMWRMCPIFKGKTIYIEFCQCNVQSHTEVNCFASRGTEA
ncbi:hypothetical protein TELCIR_17272 [Teladorsagia circumcincta]|uniref:Transporter n=1 Tax=Teladorsagia circumcincta TaxID=45464 RepID=A0A2G9TT77_TELCI|nr:hypothetical protein TELCIR_17272 [Teladorsagia circumcincta]